MKSGKLKKLADQYSEVADKFKAQAKAAKEKQEEIQMLIDNLKKYEATQESLNELIGFLGGQQN